MRWEFYSRPKSTISKYRRRKLSRERYAAYLKEQYNKEEPPPPPLRKSARKDKEQRQEENEAGYHRECEKQWTKHEDDHYRLPDPAYRKPIISTQEALAIVKNMKELHSIPLNLWDDFWSDGCVPDGEVQETYAYIEEYDVLTDENKQAIVDHLFNYLQRLDLTGVEVEKGDDRIYFKHLTHERLDRLVRELRLAELTFEGLPFHVYSES